MRYGMVIDMLKCMGCQACVVACRAEQGTPPGVLYNRVEQMDIGRFPRSRPVFVPTACHHCDDPDCVKACPTGASFKREDGLVLIGPDQCIGCQACVPACRYGARTMIRKVEPYYEAHSPTPYETKVTSRHQPGKVEKCNFCLHRLEQGRLPACVETCPALARVFGDLDDPDSPPSKLLRQYPAQVTALDAETRPSFFYIRSDENGSIAKIVEEMRASAQDCN